MIGWIAGWSRCFIICAGNASSVVTCRDGRQATVFFPDNYSTSDGNATGSHAALSFYKRLLRGKPPSGSVFSKLFELLEAM